MSWMRKSERKKLDDQYEAIIATLRKYPRIFFAELSDRSGVPRPRLKPCLNHLLMEKKIVAERRYNAGSRQMANKYSVVSDARSACVGITGDDLAWMDYYRKPRLERLRERIGALS